jgi:hypothetical protein
MTCVHTENNAETHVPDWAHNIDEV